MEIAVDEALIIDGQGRASDGAAAVAALAASGVTALVCASDAVALGALHAAQERGIAVPGQISIIGADDVEVASLVHPGLTTIHTNHQDIARKAAEVMARRIEDPELDRMEVVLRPVLVQRGTTARAA